MIRALIIAAIAAMAGVLAYLWAQPGCPGGHLVASEAACVRMAGFDTLFCRGVFSRTSDIAKVSGPSYPSLWECNSAWPKCMERGPTGEAVPVPTSWCVTRAPGGSIERLEPQYDNRRQ